MSTIRTVSAAPAVPAEIGPWSHAVVAGDLVFVSGCPPWDPRTNALNLGPFDAQARQCLANLRTIVEHAGSALERIVKVTVYLQDIKDFDRMNVLYEEFFGAHKPARTVVEVANNPKGISFYFDAIASLK